VAVGGLGLGREGQNGEVMRSGEGGGGAWVGVERHVRHVGMYIGEDRGEEGGQGRAGQGREGKGFYVPNGVKGRKRGGVDWMGVGS